MSSRFPALILCIAAFIGGMRALAFDDGAASEVKVLARDGGAMRGRRSIAASGHFVAFETPPGQWRLTQIRVFASRYGTAEPPPDKWRITVCDSDFRPARFIEMPYGIFERGAERWYEIDVPALDLPAGGVFWLNLAFNPHETKGVYVGYDTADLESHSRIGLPGGRVTGMPRKMDWMIRAVVEPAAAGSADESDRWLSPPRKPEPFEKLGLIELKNDDGISEGHWSFGGAGPAVRFQSGIESARLVRLRIYARRYGSGYDPERQKVDLWIMGEDGRVIASAAFNYAVFGCEDGWAEIEITPVTAPAVFRVLVNPHADARKGIYFHYNESDAERRAEIGSAPDDLREFDRHWKWMIRAYLDERAPPAE